MSIDAANEFLMAGGAKSAKFEVIGTTVTGTIASEPEVMQQTDFRTGEPKFWNDGKPRLQMRIILATSERDPSTPDDDGNRAIYVKGQMQKAVRDAIRQAGAPGIAVGGTLAITYTGDGVADGGYPPKIYSAAYTPPAAAAANAFLATADPAPQAPAQPMNQAQLAAAARANQTPPPAPAAAPAAAPAPAGVSPEALAAIAALTPEQRAALNL